MMHHLVGLRAVSAKVWVWSNGAVTATTDGRETMVGMKDDNSLDIGQRSLVPGGVNNVEWDIDEAMKRVNGPTPNVSTPMQRRATLGK